MIAYKVVREEVSNKKFQLVSLLAGKSVSGEKSAKVIYKPDEWVEAKFGGLLCFLDLETARYWVNTENDQIWEVEVDQEVEFGSCYYYWENLKIEQVQVLWSGESEQTMAQLLGEIIPFCDNNWPPHTAAFKRVKLVKNITT